MTAPLFEPSRCPDLGGVDEAITPRINAAGFGDGYSQRGADGLNSSDRELTVNWTILKVSNVPPPRS